MKTARRHKSDPTSHDLYVEMVDSHNDWLAHYKRFGLGTGAAHHAPREERHKNHGLWVKYQNRKRKYDAAHNATKG